MEFGQLIQGLSYEEYASKPGLRASHLKLLKRSPAHFKHSLMNPKEQSEAMERGTIVHAALESREKFMDEYIVEPEFIGKTKDGKDSAQSAEAKEKKKAWYAGLKPGQKVVPANFHDQLVGILNAVSNHRILRNMLEGGVRESSLWVKDPETGETLQCRPDFITRHGFILDFKTTRDARAEFFRNEIFSSKYAESPFYILGAAHYSHCARIAGLERPDSFTFVALEKTPPYGIMIYPMDIGCLGPGEQWRSHLTEKYAACKTKDVWPAYDEQVVPVVPPEWVELPVALE